MKYAPILFFLFAVMVSPLRAEDAILFDETFQGALQPGWSWVREVPAQHRFAEGGGLEICMEPNPADGIRNILVRGVPEMAEGPVIIQLEVDSDQPFSGQFQQVGLYWMKGDDVKFKFVKEFIDDELFVFPGKQPLATQKVTLRLVVDGEKVTGFFKPDGAAEFQHVCEATLPQRNDDDDRIAIQCWHGPAGDECWTRLTRFQILSTEKAE